MPLAVQNTQQFNPFPEAVTVTSVRKTGNVAQDVANGAVYRGLSKEGAKSFGVYTASDLNVRVGMGDLPFAPKPRDTVAYDGVTYTVLQVNSSKLLQFWGLDVRALGLAADLRDTLTLKRPANAAADGGLRQATYTDLAADVPARFQETEAETGDRLGKRQATRRFEVYVAQRLFPQALDRLVDQDGRVFQVTGWRDADRIDGLETIECELVT